MMNMKKEEQNADKQPSIAESQKTEESSKKASTAIELLEPTAPRYIYVNNDNNQVHLLMPIIGGASIATDNTCKSLSALQNFISQSLKELETYQSALEYDIELLNKFTTESSELIKSKQQRLKQINHYITEIHAYKGADWLETPYSYPEPIKKILSKRENFYSIVLRPKNQDSILNTVNPVFEVDRSSNNGLYSNLQEIYKNVTQWKISTKTAEELFKEMIVAQLGEKPCKSEADIKAIQNALQATTKETFNQSIDFTKATLKNVSENFVLTKENIDNFMGFNENNTQTSEYVDFILNMCTPNLFDEIPESFQDLAQSPFNTIKASTNQQETLSILTQFFLAEVNLYCYVNKLSTGNFGDILDKNKDLAENVGITVKNALISGGNVEKALFELVNQNITKFGMSQQLKEEDKTNIQQKFIAHYNTIKGSPHYDEFMIFDEACPNDNQNSKGFIHQGNFCIDFSDFYITDKAEKNDLDLSEYFLDTHAKSQQNPHELSGTNINTISDSLKIKINQENLLNIFNNYHENQKIIELMLTKNAKSIIDDGLLAKLTDIDSINSIFEWACTNNHLNIIEKLLQYPDVNINKPNNKGKTPLYLACENNHASVVEKLLQHPNIEVNKADKYAQTPLFLACYEGYDSVVEKLLQHPKIEVNKGNIYENTPLVLACRDGHTNIVEKLLQHPNIDINKANEDGDTPLFWASCRRRPSVVEKLLQHPKIDVNKANRDREIPLYQAILTNNASVVEKLLRHPNIDVNKPDKYGTPLDLAYENGYTKIIGMLLEKENIKINEKLKYDLFNMAYRNGEAKIVEQLIKHHHVNINKLDTDGALPLIHACKNGHAETVKALLKHKDIDINQPDKDGTSPLIHACKKGDAKIVEALLKHKDIDVNQRDKHHRTPLIWSCIKNFVNITKKLLGYKNIKPNQVDKDQKTALDWAIEKGNGGCVEALLLNENKLPLHWLIQQDKLEIAKQLITKPNTNINQADEHGKTPLHLAIKSGKVDIINELLAQPNIKINQADIYGITPLHLAISKGDEAIIALLLTRPDINPNKPDNDGKTPQDWAVRKKLDDVTQLFKAIEMSKESNINDNDITQTDLGHFKAYSPLRSTKSEKNKESSLQEKSKLSSPKSTSSK